jgi:serine-type D-Ala-D-Ala carboxypeptidase (penicillin-binding protein 5/6)
MKKGFVIWLILLCWIEFADARQVSKIRPAEKEDACKAYMVVEGATGKMLEGENIHLKWPPASITKLMSACVIMERLSKGELQLTDTITVSREASKMGGSQVFLKQGEAFTIEDLMKAMLVASGNDAAYALAEHVAGSKEGFVALMNEKARNLNMQDTEFHSVHGLPPSHDEPDDLTSCYDLTLLAKELLKYPKLIEWTSIQTETFRGGTFIMTNHNKLLGRMSGVDGLKTGYYRKAGYNVVVTAKRGGLRLIAVVMGGVDARTRDRIAEEKLKAGFAAYEMANVVNKGDVIEKEIMVPNGELRKIKGIAKESFSYPIPRNKKGAIKKETNLPEKLEAEIKQGQPLGEMTIKLDNEVIGKVEIISPVRIPKAGYWLRIKRAVGLGA